MDNRKNCAVGSGLATLGGIALSSLLGTTFLCGTASPSLAAADDHDVLDVSDLERVADGSLDDLRGGFNINGYELSFGITITTSVNGQQLLQTSFNVNQPGQINGVVTNYIQQQQAAIAGNVGNGSSGAGASGNGPNLGDIEIEVEIDEDGEIDIDIDSDVDFDEDDAPEIAQAIDDLKTAMVVVENGGGSATAGDTQVATTTSASDANGEAVSGISAPATVADFQPSAAAPLPLGGSGGGETPGDSPVDISGIENQATSNSASAPSVATWIASELADGKGVQVSSSDLATTIIQHIGNGVSTSITNSANDMTIEHTTEMNVYFENFAEMQAQAITADVMSGLMADITSRTNAGL